NFSDPGTVEPIPQDFHATVCWGDGNSDDGIITVDGEGGFIVTASHTWAKWGEYPMSVTIEDVQAPADPIQWSGNAEVGDIAPIAYGDPYANTYLSVGDTFVASGYFTDPGADTWTGTVDYGDGTGLQSLTLNPDKTFTLSHTYTTVGQFSVNVTIYDTLWPSD